MSALLATSEKIKIRASVNEWISKSLPLHRKYVKHSDPEFDKHERAWRVLLHAKDSSEQVGTVFVSSDAAVLKAESPNKIAKRIDRIGLNKAEINQSPNYLTGEYYDFLWGDGISGSNQFSTGEIDLLLTDPPYGISKPYTCEQQVPRRLRSNGRDFIMPKGNFGEWDCIDPAEWLNVVLPRVGGWVVSFCSQAQIGEYQNIYRKHKLVAVGAMVWHKTNPVPFNHKFKPINAWEAMAVGKRPGTKFNGKVIHNVFRHKSPSPQHRIHPTQKPLALMEYFIELFTNQDDLVFDPFGGAATTLIAAVNKKRRSVSYELNEDIYQAACKRIVEQVGV